ncbi:MAG TPA: NAD(+)/NADH kinase [Chthoniobacterales bacterium]|nr:NAD(+)/NADH kinase [Chthoniobacterales bacterium]
MSSLTLGLYAHWRKPGAANSLRALCQALERVGIKTLLERNSAELLGEKGLTLEELRDQVDFFITLGGDGTLLRLVRDLRGKMKPVMGINFGSLGFLTGFGGPSFDEAAKALASGDYRLEERTMLEACVPGFDGELVSRVGLNDVVVSRGERSRLVQIEVSIDQTCLTEYNADGLIVATSTGSTAYSLSAGGPIVIPNSGVFVVTPICPHVLTNRSVVVSNRSTIRLKASRSGDQPISLSIDGQEPVHFHVGDEVTVKAADTVLPLVLPSHLNFADVLRGKLRWSGTAI